MDSLVFQRLDDTSLDVLCDFEKQQSEGHYDGFWSRAHFEGEFKEGVIIAAYFEKRLVGYGAFRCQVDVWSVMNVRVAKAERSKGIARALIEQGMNFARQTSDLLEIWLEVRESNAAAIRCYRALDFEELGRRKGYYPCEEGREDALMMRTFL